MLVVTILIAVLLTVVIIPISIRVSHNSRLNDRSVTKSAEAMAENIYSAIQKYAAPHTSNVSEDIRSVKVTTEYVEIEYRYNRQLINYVDFNYVMDVINGCDLKLLRLNQALVKLLGVDKWAVKITDENGDFIPSEDLTVKIYHDSWHSFTTFYYGSNRCSTVKAEIITRSQYNKLIMERNKRHFAHKF